jgi:hypothetical protein
MAWISDNIRIRLGICKIFITIKLNLLLLLYDAINIANTSKFYSKNPNDNNSFKVNILSTLLSGVKTKANTGLILTTYII